MLPRLRSAGLGPIKLGLLSFFLSSSNAQSGDFPLGKPRDLRALRVRRRGALPELRVKNWPSRLLLYICPAEQNAPIEKTSYLPSPLPIAIVVGLFFDDYLFLFTTRSLTFTRDNEAKQAWFNGRGSRGSRNGISRSACGGYHPPLCGCCFLPVFLPATRRREIFR